MRLDLSAFQYMTNEDFRVLIAIEMGMRNHEIVPVDLIQSISKLKKVNVSKVIANLLKHKLIKHTNIQYDGYSLNYLGYDYLAINSLIKQGVLVKIGSKLGVGKESDVYICYVKNTNNEISEEQYNKIKADILTEKAKEENEEEQNENEENEEEEQQQDKDIEVSYFQNNLPKTLDSFNGELTIAAIKFARLGRTSFRAVKEKRDYVKKNTHYNWLYLSRLSAMNEYKFMTGLFNNKFCVPRPYGYNRHCIIMEYIPSYPLCRVEEIKNKDIVYHKLIDFILNLAENGLIHGDFNEFNILLNYNDESDICVIDFPQMISLDHIEAEKYFNRDVNCIKAFFKRKFNLKFDDVISFYDIKRVGRLDKELKAYGYSKEENEKDKESIDEEEEDEKEEDVNEIKKEDVMNLNLDDELDFEKEQREKCDMVMQKGKTKKKYTPEDIKEKVKQMLNKSNNKNNNKMGNRFKTKKKSFTKNEIKNIY